MMKFFTRGLIIVLFGASSSLFASGPIKTEFNSEAYKKRAAAVVALHEYYQSRENDVSDAFRSCVNAGLERFLALGIPNATQQSVVTLACAQEIESVTELNMDKR